MALDIPDLLINPHYQDRYFDVVNAMDEARSVYFENGKVLEHLQVHGQICIGETGFGAGRVLLTLLHALQQRAQGQDWRLDFYSVELHPLPAARQAELLKLFAGQDPQLDELIHALSALYARFDLSQRDRWQVQSLRTAFGEVRLHLWLGEALEMLRALEQEGQLCDLWCLEGHGPKANPAIWRHEVIEAIGQLTPTGGYCATFTVSAELRRELRAAGFNTQRLPGLGGKKEILRGQKRAPRSAPQTQIQVENYQEHWPGQFQKVAQALRALNLPRLMAIEHVGSTSVPGLLARPIVDLAVISSSQSQSLLPALESMGYVRQDSAQPQHVELTRERSGEQMAQRLYLFDVDSSFLHQQLRIRDLLRESSAQRAAYARVKEEMIARFPRDHGAYRGAKIKIFNQLLTRQTKP